ncbi:MAG: cyclophilin-like fold protein [Thermodesulfobacteriota bacterium]
MKIRLEAGPVIAEAELADTVTARSIYEALPLEAEALTWGDEIYFEIPVKKSLDETARELVEKGDLGYWPTGRAFCIFFGPTPISAAGEIRPASAVNLIGRIIGRSDDFKKVPEGARVSLTRL